MLHWLAGSVAVAVEVIVTVFVVAGVVVGVVPQGVATARIGRARRERYLAAIIVVESIRV